MRIWTAWSNIKRSFGQSDKIEKKINNGEDDCFTMRISEISGEIQIYVWPCANGDGQRMEKLYERITGCTGHHIFQRVRIQRGTPVGSWRNRFRLVFVVHPGNERWILGLGWANTVVTSNTQKKQCLPQKTNRTHIRRSQSGKQWGNLTVILDKASIEIGKHQKALQFLKLIEVLDHFTARIFSGSTMTVLLWIIKSKK